MITAIEIVSATSQPCRACGAVHTLRLALLAAEPSDEELLLGFFARCPVAGCRTWLVVPVPLAPDGHSRLLRIGPPDDAEWEPEPTLPPPAPARPEPVSRGVPLRGLRDFTRTPDLLRRALGCPIG